MTVYLLYCVYENKELEEVVDVFSTMHKALSHVKHIEGASPQWSTEQGRTTTFESDLNKWHYEIVERRVN